MLLTSCLKYILIYTWYVYTEYYFLSEIISSSRSDCIIIFLSMAAKMSLNINIINLFIYLFTWNNDAKVKIKIQQNNTEKYKKLIIIFKLIEVIYYMRVNINYW